MEEKIILKKMEETGLVPVVVIENPEDAVPTAKALLQGGIGMMEITFRTSCAKDAIAIVKKEVPDMVVGAGTILDVKQAQDAVSAGAEFIVSPGFSEEVVRWCNDNKTAVVPGCVTPTEIIAARSLGLSVVKFFPANLFGGIKAIKTLSGVFRDMRFLPTGGVNLENISEFASEKCIVAIGGSFVCTSKDIREHNFETITKLSKESVDKIRAARV
ncbi:MAG: bifunctional 4-hydroxy-2-oxoglutarate aldolase/2-dehydro-3-deoxy-phosphogluconate aldolase [Saccharofermentanaceae bacterium]|nr:bifunctional 4-hydroxy-2-oxoglutarate aldolase/2-dehydro-3-deoxy-phosphogluconate aldolase [Saccharofermentanaceae bacterium]